MATIKIRGQAVNLNIAQEMEAFDWIRPRWSSNKLIAASPFRYDNTPSFFVNLNGPYAGTWGDSGAYDAEWASGGLVKLLAFLRNETYEETEDYLLSAYGYSEVATDIKLDVPRLKVQRVRQPLKEQILFELTENYSYLESRCISANVQRQMGVLYDEHNRAIAIPWRRANGGLANVKYRKTSGKLFWYDKTCSGIPVRELVYGIERAGPRSILCEAEIDAMSFMQAGYSAVAIGGVSFNEIKRDIIKRSRIEELIIASDNDKAGGKLRKEVEQSLRGSVRIRHAYIEGAKDANESLVKFGEESLVKAVEQSEVCKSLYVNSRTFSWSK